VTHDFEQLQAGSEKQTSGVCTSSALTKRLEGSWTGEDGVAEVRATGHGNLQNAMFGSHGGLPSCDAGYADLRHDCYTLACRAAQVAPNIHAGD
jgi:hypothetical protein